MASICHFYRICNLQIYPAMTHRGDDLYLFALLETFNLQSVFSDVVSHGNEAIQKRCLPQFSCRTEYLGLAMEYIHMNGKNRQVEMTHVCLSFSHSRVSMTLCLEHITT